MSVERKTGLHSIEFNADGSLLVRIQKTVVVDGEVLKQDWHPALIGPDEDAAEHLGRVNANLEMMGFGRVDAVSIKLAETVVAEARKAQQEVASAASLEALPAGKG